MGILDTPVHFRGFAKAPTTPQTSDVWAVPYDLRGKGCLLRKDTGAGNQSVNAITYTRVSFTKKDEDALAFHDGISQPGRIVIPDLTPFGVSALVCEFVGQLLIASTTHNSYGIRRASLWLNGTPGPSNGTNIGTSEQTMEGPGTATYSPRLQVRGRRTKMVAGDYVEMAFYHDATNDNDGVTFTSVSLQPAETWLQMTIVEAVG